MGRLRAHRRPIIGITSYTRDRFNACRLVRRIRREIPESVIVVGGHHFGYLAEETLAALPEVDIVVRGEGELTFKEICDAVSSSHSYNDILGISYRENAEYVHTTDRPLETNLDLFRCFDAHDLQAEGRHGLLSEAKVLNQPCFTIFASRGCPNQCVFCSVKSSKVRFRSIDSIIAEIEEKIRITGIRNVSFADSSLTLKKGFITELCEALIRRNLNVRWNCYSRVDIDPDILQLMHRAGMVSAEIGLESGSPRVLQAIRKNIDLDQFERFAREAYRLGIKLFVFCLISLPSETRDDFQKTISFARKVSRYVYRFGIQTVRILPDAALYRMALEKKILPPDFSWFTPYHYEDPEKIQNPFYAAIPPYLEHLTPRDIQELLRQFNQHRMAECTSLREFLGPIRSNLRTASFRNMSLKKLRRKGVTAVSMVRGVVNKFRKDRYFEKRPEKYFDI
jgi:radical SAM superfamily enzyme YgiQ (UPF0313 family)